MARPCSICDHAERREIDALLARGESIAKISREFDVSDDALYRHRNAGHTVMGMIESVAVNDTGAPGSLKDQLDKLQRDTLDILHDAKTRGDGRLALSAVVVAARNVECMIKLDHELFERMKESEEKQARDITHRVVFIYPQAPEVMNPEDIAIALPSNGREVVPMPEIVPPCTTTEVKPEPKPVEKSKQAEKHDICYKSVHDVQEKGIPGMWST